MVQLQGSQATPVNSSSSSITYQSTPLLVTEEFDSGAGNAYYEGERGPLGDVEFSRNKLCKKIMGMCYLTGKKTH